MAGVANSEVHSPRPNPDARAWAPVATEEAPAEHGPPKASAVVPDQQNDEDVSTQNDIGLFWQSNSSDKVPCLLLIPKFRNSPMELAGQHSPWASLSLGSQRSLESLRKAPEAADSTTSVHVRAECLRVFDACPKSLKRHVQVEQGEGQQVFTI